jgi:glutathione S-transferase
MLKVYGRPNSINVRKVLWMLGELGLQYEREDWGRGFKSTDDPAFRRINPVGVVPVVDDGAFRLRESNSIVRYLAEKHGRADLYPKALEARATVESFMDWASTELASGMRPVFHGLVVKNPAYVGMVDAGAKEWAQQMQILEDHLAAKGPYVMGESFTIGDIPVGLAASRRSRSYPPTTTG